MKQKIKQLLAGCLSAALAISSPLTSFANSVGSNADGTDSAGNVTASGGDFSANITNTLTSGKIGVRLSLVDANDPSQIISVDDNGNPTVVDLLYVDQETFKHQTAENYWSNLESRYTYTNVKTQNLKTLADGDVTWTRIYYDEIQSWFEGQTMMPPWLIHNGAYVSQGTTFSKWCKSNEYNKSLDDDDTGGLLFYTVSGSGYAVKAPIFKTSWNDGSSSEMVWANVGHKYLAVGWGNKGDSDSDKIKSALVTNLADLSDDSLSANAIATSLLVLDACVSALEATSGANDSDVTSYRAQIAQAKAQLLKTDPAKYATADAQVKAQVQKSGLDPTDIPNNAVALSTPSADSGAATGDAAQYHIVQILNQKDGNGSYYLQTASMVDSRKNPEKYGGSILTLSDCTEDWVLLVEPLVWLTIYPEGDDSRIVHTKMYGTITNFVQAFNTDPALAKYKNSKFFNWKALNQACWWALSVNSSGFGFAGSDLGFRAPENTGSYRPFADLYRGLTVPQTQTVTVARLQDDGTVEKTQEERSCIEGWGVNVYWKGMIPEEPQPTTQPDDTDDNGSKIKLAKWYVVETKTESGDTQQSVVGVKTGYVDKYLMVANELVNEGNGVYEVRGWITGKDATAVPEDGDLDSTFEEYAKKSPGSAWGTTAAVVNMSEFPEDKVLYVKLVYTPTTEQGTITVIKVKDKTDGSTVIEKDSTNPGVYNATEEGWEYKEDTQTPDDEIPVSKWPDVPQGTSGNNPQIPVLDTTHTLYIHYTEKPQSPVEGGRARNGQSAFLVCPPFYGQCHV